MVTITKENSLVRKPLDLATGKEVPKSKYAFFPGIQLSASEPEIVVKAYDSLRFQYPDTAIFLQKCDMNEKDLLRSQWENLGKPIIIAACMKAYKKFKEELPEIPVVSFYEMMLDMGISGGCNSVDYVVLDPESAKDEEKTRAAVRELADGMGAKLHDACEAESKDGDKNIGGVEAGSAELGSTEPGSAETGDYPFITYSITERDEIKNSGKDAVHILELVYGMGASNTHMIHEHDHDDENGGALDETEANKNHSIPLAEPDCDGNCASCSSSCGLRPTPPAPLPTDEEKQQNLAELKQVLLALYWNEM